VNARDQALDIIRRLPSDSSTHDILEELLFKAQVDEGLRDIEAGRVLSHTALRRRMARWRKSAGR
jgi:predicted transcriptional regulator